MRVLFLPRLGFEVQDVNEAVTYLQKVDVAGDEIGIEVEGEAAIAVITVAVEKLFFSPEFRKMSPDLMTGNVSKIERAVYRAS